MKTIQKSEAGNEMTKLLLNGLSYAKAPHSIIIVHFTSYTIHGVKLCSINL